MSMSKQRTLGISLQEVQFRLVQKLNNLKDQVYGQRAFGMSNEELDPRHSYVREVNLFLESAELDDIRKRYFTSFQVQEETKRMLLKDFEQNTDRHFSAAERIIKKKFSILGHADLYFGNEIDWKFDPINKVHSPQIYWSKINYLDFGECGDHKVIWELNRHQHFITLGKAYWITGDEKYAQEWVDQTCHWILSNPPKTGINWASSLEVAFRSIAWIWAFLFFQSSKKVDYEFWQKYFYVLYINGLHIEKNLSYYFSPNTHLTGEA